MFNPIQEDSELPVGSFPEKLRDLINIYSIEDGSNTPDYILACYLIHCLEAFDEATRERNKFWESSDIGPPATKVKN